MFLLVAFRRTTIAYRPTSRGPHRVLGLCAKGGGFDRRLSRARKYRNAATARKAAKALQRRLDPHGAFLKVTSASAKSLPWVGQSKVLAIAENSRG